MSRSKGINGKDYIQLTEGHELIGIDEAASLYGCQRDRIQNFIVRGMLHPFFDMQEVDRLRQEHIHKHMIGRLTPRRSRH